MLNTLKRGYMNKIRDRFLFYTVTLPETDDIGPVFI